MKKLLFLFLTVLLFSGCSSMDRSECALADWRAIGYQQGVAGEALSGFVDFQNDCASHGVKADYEAYQEGHEQGQAEYCSYQRALDAGRRGEYTSQVCLNGKHPRYIEGYKVGQSLFCHYERGLNQGAEGADFDSRCPSAQFADYDRGYLAGLLRYCTFSNGFQSGLNGDPYNANCTAVDSSEFDKGYESGKARYVDLSRLDELKQRLNWLDQQISRSQSKLLEAEQVIASETSTADARKLALEKFKRIQQELSRMELEYSDVQREATILAAQLNSGS